MVSIFVYPLSATVINIFDYEHKNWALITFGVMEFIKFTLSFYMEGALRSNIETTCRGRSDKFKAAGQFVEHLCKFILFGTVGLLITWMIGSARVQKRNPWNYTLSFLGLIIPLIISYILIGIAQAIEDDKDNNNNRR